MNNKFLKGSPELGTKIKQRRNELGYTIEEAASKAGVGTKTWSRYESGSSIRSDKFPNVCKVLNWNKIPDFEENDTKFDINEYKNNSAWSQYLANNFGEAAAISFVIGSETLLDDVTQDLDCLSSKPKYTHVGELDISWTKDLLPPQFLTRYDYDLLYYLKDILVKFRKTASKCANFMAHTVAEEIVLYAIMEESRFLMKGIAAQLHSDNGDWDNWVFDIFDDMDVVTYLYSDSYLNENNPYHFNHWKENQFYCND